jgi:hypothetical protein
LLNLLFMSPCGHAEAGGIVGGSTTEEAGAVGAGTEPETDLKGGKARLISVCDLDEEG